MSGATSSYDYVIIGGGTAGLALASRLAEDVSITVCVLEAGSDISQDPNVKIPGYFYHNFGKSSDWAFLSTPQAGANNRPIYLPRGKSVGGTSNLNLMTLGRAPPQEYDAFQALGAEGWNSKEFLRYFKKSSTLKYPQEMADSMGLKVASENHGDGPIINTLPIVSPDVYPYFVKACERVGVPFNPDATAGRNIGVWPSANSIDPMNATRISSVTAYYDCVKSNSNLTIIADVRVTRIVFAEQKDVDGQVIARKVEFTSKGESNHVDVKKEVIVSAGAYQTPQVLELSGIGNPNILHKHGVQTVVELPGVGENLQEHPSAFVVFSHDPKLESFDVLHDPTRGAAELKLYEEKKEGMLTTVPLSYAFMPLKTCAGSTSTAIKELSSTGEDSASLIPPRAYELQKSWLADDQIPQLEIILVPNFIPSSVKSVPDSGKRYFSLTIVVTHPFSRGSVHIGSADHLAPPVIDLALFNHPVDLEVLVNGVKFVRKLCAAEPLKDIVLEEAVPGPGVEDDDAIKEFVRNVASTTHHPLGSAAMLPREEGGVVDAKLKVYGTKNVRVVDASIIPIQIAAHPQATVYAIAEKAADIIKGIST